jgi:hypothetical protein
MKNLVYKLSKIAAAQKMLIEVLQSKTTLDKQQNENFGNLFNENQKLMRDVAAKYLTLKNRSIDKIINTKTYLSDHIKEVENALFELKKENNLKFSNDYIKFINVSNYAT